MSQTRAALLVLGALVVGACGGPSQVLVDDTAQVERQQRANVPAIGDGGADARAVADPAAAWLARRQQLANADSWSVYGKLAMRSETDAWSATLQWRQTGDEFRIRLSGPFGAGALQIEGDAEGVQLRTADGRIAQASSPEELLYQHMGWSLPLSGMRYWILGRTAPQDDVPAEQITVDEAGRVMRFEQSDWRVGYPAYQDVDGFSMPRKATLDSDRVKGNVLITRWTIDLPEPPAGDSVPASESELAAAGEAANSEQSVISTDEEGLAGSTDESSDTPTDDSAVVQTPVQSQTPEELWRHRRQAILALNNWKAFGRLTATSGDHAVSLMLYWRHDEDAYTIRLSEPLAAGGVEVNVTRRRASLTASDGIVVQDRRPEPLIEQQLGIKIPVANLRYWLLGRVRPDLEVDQVFIDGEGRVLYFDQARWRVEYVSYDSARSDAMPKHVYLSDGTTKIAIRVSAWNTGAASNPE